MNKLENFFYLDLEIKELLNKLNIYTYSKTNMNNFYKNMLDSIDIIRKSLIKIASMFNFSDIIKYRIKYFFDAIEEEAMKIDSQSELEFFVFDRLHKLRSNFVDNVKDNCYGSAQNNDSKDDPTLEKLLNMASSINEFIHAIHSYISNNEKYYEEVKFIASKNNHEDYPITLRGREYPLALELFNNFPLDLDVGWTDIISLDKKILIIVRDRGHALTIDIDLTNLDSIIVSYFIPKICNLEMVQRIKGINVSNKSSCLDNAVGDFETNHDNLINDIYELISMVPTDNDIKKTTF